MSEILNDIIYWCGVIFIFYIGCVIIGMIILKIKEITYDAHENLIELSNLRRNCKKARKEIENLNLNDYGDNLYQFQAKCIEILDKLIDSET